MTEDELRHAVGDRVYDSFAPHGLLYNHDAEDLDNLTLLGTTDQGEEVEINKRAAESDLLVYVNINIVVHGRRLEEHGHRAGQLPQHPPPPQRQDHAALPVVHGPPPQSELHSSNWRMGKVLRDAGVKVFQIETTINNDVFGTEGPLSVLQKREWEWSARDRVTFLGMKAGLDRMLGPPAPRQSSSRGRRRTSMTSVQAGEVEAVHEETTANGAAPAPGAGRGPDRHPDHGAALHLPLQRELDHEPDPGHVPRARLLLQPVPRASRRCARAACSS